MQKETRNIRGGSYEENVRDHLGIENTTDEGKDELDDATMEPDPGRSIIGVQPATTRRGAALGRGSSATMLVQTSKTLYEVPLSSDDSEKLAASDTTDPEVAAEEEELLAADAGAMRRTARVNVAFPASTVATILRGSFTLTDPDVEDLPAYQRELYFRPVSVSVICIIWLTLVALLMYTTLAMVRNLDELSGKTEHSWFVGVMESVHQGTMITPVMSLLFLATRMYVLAQTRGLGEPSAELKAFEIIATVGFTLQVLILLFLGLSGHREESLDDAADGGVQQIQPMIVNMAQSSLRTLPVQYFSIACMFGGILVVLLHLAVPMLQSGFDNMSVPVQCAVVLIAAHFFTEVGVWTQKQLSGKVDMKGNWAAASAAMSKAPMLVVFFLASRMRFMQYYPPDGKPPFIFRTAFKVVTVAQLLETITFVYMGISGTQTMGYYNTVEFAMKKRWQMVVRHAVSAVGWVALVVLFVSFKRSVDLEGAPPMSPTMFCIVVLCFVFFSTHFGSWVGSMLRDIRQVDMPVTMNTLAAAMVSVQLCPLMCVLFLAARMRALQITEGEGSPQWWEQDCVLLCISAIIVQVICCIAMPVFTGEASSIGPDGTVLYDLRPMIGAYIVTVMKYAALFAIYAGFIGICMAVFTMTPETATGTRVTDSDFNKSLIRSALWVLVLLLIGSILSSAKVIGLAVKFALEAVDESYLGIKIEVDTVAINVWHGFVNVRALVAFNPEGKGFHTPHILRVGTFRLKVNIGRLLKTRGKVFEITELVMENTSINFEYAVHGSNVGCVLAFLDSQAATDSEEGKAASDGKADTTTAAPSDGNADTAEVSPPVKDEAADAPAAPATPDADEGCQVELKRLRIENITATVHMPKMGPMASVVLANFDGGLPLSGDASTQTVRFIIRFVVKTLLKSALSSLTGLGLLASQGAKGALMRTAGKICCGGCDRPQQSRRPPGGASSAGGSGSDAGVDGGS